MTWLGRECTIPCQAQTCALLGALPKYKHLEALSSPRSVSGGLEIGLTSEEKRTLSRFRIEIPLLLRLPGAVATAEAKTRDLSASGVFFYTDFEFAQNAEIDFVMTLPAELTHTGGVQVICKAKVVRVQCDSLTGHIGIAAAIYSFDFIAAATSSSGNGS
jgi:PilZ domain